MKGKGKHALENRLKESSLQITALLEDEHTDPERIVGALKYHDALLKLGSNSKRGKTTRLTFCLAGSLLIIVSLLSIPRLNQTEIVIDGSSKAIIVGLGKKDTNLLTGEVSFLRVLGKNSATLCSLDSSRAGCSRVERIAVHHVTVFSQGVVRLRHNANCGQVTLLGGDGKMSFKIDETGVDEGSSLPLHGFRTFDLHPFETIEYCMAHDSSLIIEDPTYFVVGDTEGYGIAERELLPSFVSGEVAFAASSKTTRLSATDIARIDNYEHSTLVVRRGENLKFATKVRRGQIGLIQCETIASQNPSWLQVLMDSPVSKTGFALLVGIWTALQFFRKQLDL